MAEISNVFLATLSGEPTETTPIWLMRQAGRYLPEYRAVRKRAGDFLGLCYTPDLATEVTLQPIRRFGFDAAILFSDILVVPDGLGQRVGFRTGEGPVLEALRNEAAIDALSFGRLVGHLAPVYRAARQIRAELPTDTALIGFAGSPWTVATYMVEGGSSKDFAKVKTFAFSEPVVFAKLIDLLERSTVAHLEAQIAAGVQAVQLFDSWAGVLPPNALRHWVIDPTARIVERLRSRYSDVPIIGFPRQAGLHYQAYVDQTGVDAVGLDTTVPSEWAVEELGGKVALQGNLDPALLMAGGQALLDAATETWLGFRDSQHIFNLGHGVLQHTPPDNVAKLVDHLRSLDAKGSAA
ncbi:MAG: uroporphyrinogen decarboxylase [Pseudomonadota bacterium]